MEKLIKYSIEAVLVILMTALIAGLLIFLEMYFFTNGQISINFWSVSGACALLNLTAIVILSNMLSNNLISKIFGDE